PACPVEIPMPCRLPPPHACLAVTALLLTGPILALAAPPFVGPVEPPTFRVQPYLQLPTPSGMTIMWETNRRLPSRVEYGTTPAVGQVAEVAGAEVLHEVRLQGLLPGTAYFYRVRSGEVTSDVYQFRTAPPPGTKHWRLALYGDSRSNPAT